MYGVEYTNEEINEAITSSNPWEIVPSRDLDGHGTFVAGVACGTYIEEKGFSGAAPLATICVVKCKEAKNTLKQYYQIDTDEPVYSETDIMTAVAYLGTKALELGMPFILCLSMGTSNGSHTNGGVLGNMLREIGDYRGVGIVKPCGNEANTSRHYRS